MFDEEYREVAVKANRHLRAGEYISYAETLSEMGRILVKEKRYTDALVRAILRYYVLLSGVPCEPVIDSEAVNIGQLCVYELRMERYALGELYFDTIRSDTMPSHIMTVSDSMYLFELCMYGRAPEADELLANIIKTK